MLLTYCKFSAQVAMGQGEVDHSQKVPCLVPVRFSPRPSRSIRFGDVSEANGRGKPRQKQTAHAFVLFFKMADFTGL